MVAESGEDLAEDGGVSCCHDSRDSTSSASLFESENNRGGFTSHSLPSNVANPVPGLPFLFNKCRLLLDSFTTEAPFDLSIINERSLSGRFPAALGFTF